MCAGASNVHKSPQPAAVVAYEAALSPPRARLTAAAEQHGEQAQQDAALRHEQHMQAASPNTSPRKRWELIDASLSADSARRICRNAASCSLAVSC